MSTGMKVYGNLLACRSLVVLLSVFVVYSVVQPAFAAETDTGTTTVSFNVAEAIEVTSWPVVTFTLSDAGTPGVPVVSGAFIISVKSNAAWGLQINSDSNDGSLREFNLATGSYEAGGASLGPVEWATNVDGPWTPLSSTPTAIFTNQPATGEAGTSVGFVLRVTPTYDDAPLPAGREYRIVITYTAGVGF